MKSLGVGLLGGIGLFVAFNLFGFIGVLVLGATGIVIWIASIRDDTRERFCASLQELGVDAKLAERGRPDECSMPACNQRMGIIDILDGPIAWVNLSATDGVEYAIIGVADPSVKESHSKVKIDMVVTKSWPLFGRPIDVSWTGDDVGLGIIDKLNMDNALRDSIIDGRHDIGLGISTIPVLQSWSIGYYPMKMPTSDLWEIYEKIASHLIHRQ